MLRQPIGQARGLVLGDEIGDREGQAQKTDDPD